MDTNTEIQTDLAEAPAPEATPLFDYRGNGKVARLPKHLRNQVNHWIVDGLSYPEIIERLGEHGKDFKPDNLLIPIFPWAASSRRDLREQRNQLFPTP